MKRLFVACIYSVSAVAMLTTSACSSLRHVEIPAPPPPTAPESERVAYFNQYRPLAVARGVGSDAPSARSFAPLDPLIQLGDGRRIVNVEDLLPAVGEHSVAGKAAMRARSQGDLAKVAYTAGLSTSAVGLGIATAGVLALYASLSTTDEDVWARNAEFGFPVSIVGIVVTLVGVGVLLPAQWWGQEAELERTTAMLTYEDSLRERVGLSAPPPPQSPPDPIGE